MVSRKDIQLFYIICSLLILSVTAFAAKAYGFMNFFLLIGGLILVGFLSSVFIPPLITKFDSYYEQNRQKKYRFLSVFICAEIGILSGLVFIARKGNGLFPDQKFNFGFTITVFCFLGIVAGFILSRFIKLKDRKYKY